MPRACAAYQRLSDLNREIQDISDLQRTSCNHPTQSFPSSNSIAIKVRTLVLLNGINRANIGMVQKDAGPSLAQKTLKNLTISCELSREKLQRHRPLQAVSWPLNTTPMPPLPSWL